MATTAEGVRDMKRKLFLQKKNIAAGLFVLQIQSLRGRLAQLVERFFYTEDDTCTSQVLPTTSLLNENRKWSYDQVGYDWGRFYVNGDPLRS